MKDSENETHSTAVLIMGFIAIITLVIAVSKDSLLASFISGFIFCALLEDHLKAKRELRELQ